MNARADGIDIGWFLTRVGGWRSSPLRATGLIVLLLAVNYLLNMLVIVVPSWRSGAPLRKASTDMIGFTLIAQLLDRVGMVLYSGMLFVSDVYLGIRLSLGGAALSVLGASFLTSGALIWALTRYYCMRRWALPWRRSAIISTLAALLTNPAWAIATATLPTFIRGH